MPSRFLCSQTNSRLGLPSVSQASVSRIRKRVFSNVDVKKSSCMFSKCIECELLKDFIQKAVKGSDDWFSLHATLNNISAIKNHAVVSTIVGAMNPS